MASYIELTQGQRAIVDDLFFEELNRYKWHTDRKQKRSTYYAVRYTHRENGIVKSTSMHRSVMQLAGLDVSSIIDHRNGNGLDNRLENIRNASASQNCWNSRKQKNNTSGYKGVYWEPRRCHWFAVINVNLKRIYLGHYETSVAAAAAYNKAAIQLHGEFARLNIGLQEHD